MSELIRVRFGVAELYAGYVLCLQLYALQLHSLMVSKYNHAFCLKFNLRIYMRSDCLGFHSAYLDVYFNTKAHETQSYGAVFALCKKI